MSPENFVAILVTSDSFTLSWTLLPGLELGRLQIGYVIQCDPGDYMLTVSLTKHPPSYLYIALQISLYCMCIYVARCYT